MTPALCISHKGMGGPFKPSFGLSGVVADPTRRSVKSNGDLQFYGPFLEMFIDAGEASICVTHLARGPV